MPMAGEHFEIRKNSSGEYWWRLVASNGERIGWSGETYKSKQHTIRMAEQVRALSPSTPINDETGER
jgi:uncharacterized protein YegP (UPF0339 family)